MIRRTVTPVLAALLIALSSAACSIVGGAALRVALTDEPLNLSAAYEDESSAFVGGLVHAGSTGPTRRSFRNHCWRRDRRSHRQAAPRCRSR